MLVVVSRQVVRLGRPENEVSENEVAGFQSLAQIVARMRQLLWCVMLLGGLTSVSPALEIGDRVGPAGR